MRVDECRSCGAPVVWARYQRKDGKWKAAPFDVEPSEKGSYYLFHPEGDKSKLHGRYIKRGEEWPPGALPRTNHFATCPERKKWASGELARGADVKKAEELTRRVEKHQEEQRRREAEEIRKGDP